ncbi:MAG: DnaJ domain-containing protein [Nocardioides sp.]
MTPHWYDLLDVDPDASTDEIRAAWKAAIADLDPGDRRFRAFSEAAAVLLDPVRRAEYDAALAEAAAEPEPEPEAEPEPASDAEPERDADEQVLPSGRAGIPLAVVIVTAVATVLMVAVTVVAWLGSDSAPDSISTGPSRVDESETRAAQAAAETAIVPVISYDYRTLEADAAAATSYMTDEFGAKYEQTFPVVTENAPNTKTVITVEVVASGIVRTGDDRVDVLLFVNRPTTNKQDTEPVVYRDQVTAQMLLVDGEWLVDNLITTPAAQ